jgi:hypothetical protein
MVAAVLSFQPVTGNSATVVGGSDLFNASSLALMETWLVDDASLSYNGSLTFTNIFDKAAGATPLGFHAAADGKGPTITLMEVRQQGTTNPYQIIGGFNPLSWDSDSHYHSPADRTAFIFNLTNSDRRDQTLHSSGTLQTYNDSSYGPTFGGGHDIEIRSGLPFSLDVGHLFSQSFCTNIAVSCVGGANILGQLHSTSLEINQLEVFTISEAAVSAVPLPAALPLFVSGLGGLLFVARRRKQKAAA